MATKYRFYDNKGNVIADNIELPYKIGGLKPATTYPAGTFQYTALDELGNELGLSQVASFTTLAESAPQAPAVDATKTGSAPAK